MFVGQSVNCTAESIMVDWQSLVVFGSNLIFPYEQKVVFENLISGFISQNKFCSCFLFRMKLKFFVMTSFSFISSFQQAFQGFWMPLPEIFWGVRRIPRLELFQLDQTLRPYQLKIQIYLGQRREEKGVLGQSNSQNGHSHCLYFVLGNLVLWFWIVFQC